MSTKKNEERFQREIDRRLGIDRTPKPGDTVSSRELTPAEAAKMKKQKPSRVMWG